MRFRVLRAGCSTPERSTFVCGDHTANGYTTSSTRRTSARIPSLIWLRLREYGFCLRELDVEHGSRGVAMKDKPEQAAIKKLRALSDQLDIARRSQRAATTELTKTKSDSPRRPSRKTPPR